MKQQLLFFCVLFLPALAGAQTTITGKITDRKGEGLPGANVFIKGSYDGVNTDTDGTFSFQTSQKDTATLAVSFVGYEPVQQKIKLDQPTVQFTRKLEETATILNTVVITAGAFEASDEKRQTVLKPLDIVTTASGGADIPAVMQLLPGAQRVGDQTGLFVRGGAASETRTIIDGLAVQNPFSSGAPDVAQRSRFSPFLFKGTAFSTGGYSAQYGQALSSVLSLNTKDRAEDNDGISVGFNAAGITLSAFKKERITFSVNYTNLNPLFNVLKSNINWIHAPEAGGTSIILTQPIGKRGLLKHYTDLSMAYQGIEFRNFTGDFRASPFTVRNRNAFSMTTFQTTWDEGRWGLQTGVSYNFNRDRLGIDTVSARTQEQRIQGRAVLTRSLSSKVSLLTGAELHRYTYQNHYGIWGGSLTDWYSAVFVETEVFFTRKLAVRAGLRGERTSVINRANVSPRLSMAYKTDPYGQVSLAAGQFYQSPDQTYLLTNPKLNFEQANHLILNYQRIRENRTFRVETFYKDYRNLVRENTNGYYDPNIYRFPTNRTNNSGFGYAKGFDLFWRDKQSMKNVDYWVSYSFLDTKRLFRNYPTEAMPTFAATHTLNLVFKKYFPALGINTGATYSLASGRPYYNPGSDRFLGDKTRPYSSLSVNMSYIKILPRKFLVLYASAENLLGTKNSYGYRYTPDGRQKFAVVPPFYRFFFVGAVLSLTRKPIDPELISN
ncbi:TonB-dependent receptor [Larkinella rosea]|uniref:TonB-dependent receptor n=1 Tax=Larkinella rosea TaxID=2025312 RepID=A0A3P1BCZ3_9BACT|nr:TonB-dependent receptor [Larkinella rosea]RRA98970.1 TonB-dependent receptor [Larkinella rosea]